MDQSDQAQHQPPVVGIVAGGGGSQMAYPPQPYQSVPPPPAIGPGAPAGVGGGPHQLAYQQAQHFHHQQQQQQQQQLQAFWSGQMQEIEQCSDFKNHSLPLARIKKIMKADEDVRMISAEAPVVFAKACEMFVLELTLRSWIHTEENKRRTLQKNDIGAAIARTDVFDFLVDIIPRDELKEEGLGMVVAGGGGKVPAAAAEMQQPPPYYYHHHPHPAGMMMGKPVVDQGGMYGVQPRPPMAFVPWPQNQSQNQNHQNQHQQQPQSDA